MKEGWSRTVRRGKIKVAQAERGWLLLSCGPWKLAAEPTEDAPPWKWGGNAALCLVERWRWCGEAHGWTSLECELQHVAPD